MKRTNSVLLKLDRDTAAEVYYFGDYVRELIRRKKPNIVKILIRNYPIRSVLQYLRQNGKVKTGKEYVTFIAKDGVEAKIFFPRKNNHDKWDTSFSLRDDAKTRDFTINAMYLSISKRASSKHIIDFFNGRKDLKERKIKSIGNPRARIKRDPLYLLKAVSLAAYLNYRLDSNLFYAIKTLSENITKVDMGDVREHITSILLSKTPSKYLRILHNAGVLFHIMPELDMCYGVRQNEQYHKHDVFTHSILACDNTEPDLVLRLAALLHDVGKPQTREETPEGKATFYSHEVVSSRSSKRMLKKLGFEKEVISEVCDLVYLHMYNYEPGKWTNAAIRRFIRKAKITAEDLDKLNTFPLFLVRRADRLANGYPHKEVSYRQERFQERIVDIYKQSNVFTINDLDINGRIIMDTFNLKEGPTVGHILNYLLSLVIDDQKLNKRKILTDKASDYLSEALK